MCLGAIGVVTKVLEDDGVPVALVDTGASVETACLLTCPEAGVGADVIVHFGFVVEILGPGQAREAVRLRASTPGQRERS
jgi:hydrogenase maturation factor